MSEFPLIKDLALILMVAGVMSILCKRIKLPTIVGYLLAGLLTGPHFSFLPSVVDEHSIHTWSEIGVIFLFFAVGLEFNFKSLLKVGKIGVIIVSSIFLGAQIASFALGKLFDWGSSQCLFMGCMLAISSTMICVKAIEDLKLKGKPFVHIVYGVAVIEDILAILLLVILPMLSLSQSGSLAVEVSTSLMRIVFFMALCFIAGIFIVPTGLRKLKHWLNDELLLVVSLACCLGMVLLADGAGLSTALGAFLMGSIFGSTTEAHHIEHLMAPLKNLFGAIFFVSVGMMANPRVFLEPYNLVLIGTTLVVVVFVLPILAVLSAWAAGKPLRDAVMAGICFGNIGEFSFIIAGLGISQGILEENSYSVIITVCILSAMIMPNVLRHADAIVDWVEPKLPQKWVHRSGTATDAPEANRKKQSKRAVLIRHFLSESFILSVVIIGLIALMGGFIEPHARAFLTEQFRDFAQIGTLCDAVCLGVMLLAIMPFLGALVIRRSNLQHAFFVALVRGGGRNLMAVLKFARIALIAVLIGYAVFGHSSFDLPVNAAIALAVFVVVLTVKSFFSNYLRFEKQFLFNYNEVELAEQNEEHERLSGQMSSVSFVRQGEWLEDALTVARVRVDEDSPFLEQTLKSLNLRAKHSLFVIRIERDDPLERHAYNIPAGDSLIQLDDTIYIVGKAEDLKALTRPPYNVSSKKLHTESIRSFSKRMAEQTHDEEHLSCTAICVREDSQFAYKTLRESGIGERHKCLVIGIENDERVEMSPKPDSIFNPGTRVWIVGGDNAISALIEDNMGLKKA